MQTQNRILDDLARVAASAVGAVQGARHEVEAAIRGRLEKMLVDMDLVTREEFEVVKAMAEKAREENERLSARLAEIERQLKRD
jgi:BMFP domain-containing protein YqiC